MTTNEVKYRSVKRQKLIGNIIFILFFSALSVLFIFPLVWMISSTFKPLAHIFENPFRIIPREFSLYSIRRGWNFIGSVTFTRLYFNTFYVAIMNVVITLLTSSMTAFAFARLRFKFRGPLFVIMLSTMMLPGQITLIPTFMMLSRIGLMDNLTVLWWGSIWGGGAFNVFLIRQFMMGIPKELDEAAKIDGANIFLIYWRIILPLCKGVLLTITIFRFMSSYSDLMTPMIYINALRLQTIPPAINMYLDTAGLGRNDIAIAMSTLSIIPLIIIFFFAQKKFMQGIQTVGVKG